MTLDSWFQEVHYLVRDKQDGDFGNRGNAPRSAPFLLPRTIRCFDAVGRQDRLGCGGGGVGRGRAEQFLHAGVGEHDIRSPLQGFVVAALEAVAFFGRSQHVARFHQQVLRGFTVVSSWSSRTTSMRTTRCDKGMEPGEPGSFITSCKSCPAEAMRP